MIFRMSYGSGPWLVWNVERLWKLAEDLPVKTISLEEIQEFDEVRWFRTDESPTCRKVTEHAKRIMEVSFQYPIILNENGYVMDGLHRVAKAYVTGMTEINAVQFLHDPEPDDIIPCTPLHDK